MPTLPESLKPKIPSAFVTDVAEPLLLDMEKSAEYAKGPCGADGLPKPANERKFVFLPRFSGLGAADGAVEVMVGTAEELLLTLEEN